VGPVAHHGHPPVAIVYAGNRLGALPPQAPHLRRMLRERLRRPLNVHVSARWISLKAFSTGLAEAKKALVEVAGGELLHYRLGEPPSCEPRLPEAYMGYVAANMFWEAHTVGEAMWRRVGLPGRILAVAAGALARAQEGAPEAAVAMVRKAAAWATEARVALDAEQGESLVEEVYARGWADARPWLLPLVEAVRALL